MYKPSVYLVSLGCAKNLVDSEVMLGYLIKAKFPIVRVPNKAEIIIINTCSFIRDAKEESLETIVNLSSYKKTGACNLLIVTGCLPQRYGDALSKLIPEVDVFIGTDEFYRIVEIIEDHLNKRSSPRFYLKKPFFFMMNQPLDSIPHFREVLTSKLLRAAHINVPSVLFPASGAHFGAETQIRW